MPGSNETRRLASAGVITAAEIAGILRRGALLALLAAVAAGLVGYYASSRQPTTYAAGVGVIASQPSSDLRGLNIIAPSTVEGGVYQSAILEGDVADRALARVLGSEPSEARREAFLDSVSVRVQDAQRSSTIWVEVRNTSPTFAADAVNAIVDELVVWDRERARRALDRSVTAIERTIEDIDSQIASARADGDAERVEALQELRTQRSAELANALETRAGAMVVGLLEPLRRADPPETPVGPRVLFTTVVAVVLGLLLGYGLQILRWVFDRRVGGRDEVIDWTGLPVLAEFPPRDRRSARLAPEASGFFHTNVALATRGAATRVVAVTSPSTLAEKQGVAMSLAETFARSGKRTLLVDADMRHPGLTEWLDLVPQSAVPFDAYLEDPERQLEPVRVALGAKQGFDFVPSFTAQRFPVELLNEGFQRQLKRWEDAYEVIVLDSSPVVPFADTLSIAPFATGVVVCASEARSTRPQLEQALELLDDPHITVLGLALMDVAGGRGGSVRQRRTAGGTKTFEVRVPANARRPGRPTRRA